MNDTPIADSTLMQLSMALMQVSRAYRAAADKCIAGYGMSQAKAWPLVMIGRLGEGVRPGAVADALGMDASSLVRIFDQLIEAGLVVRVEDANDRRAKTLHLTENGRARAAELETALNAARRRLFAQIDPTDVHACMRVLQGLDAAIAREGTDHFSAADKG